jgi:hypothetical protein
MEGSNLGSACPSWIVEPQKRKKRNKNKKKKTIICTTDCRLRECGTFAFAAAE